MPKGRKEYRVDKEPFVVRGVQWDEQESVFVATGRAHVLLGIDGNTYEGKVLDLEMELAKKRKKKRGK